MTADQASFKPLLAIEDGWAAFARAPWTFLLFQLLAGGIALLFVQLAIAGASRLTGLIDTPPTTVAWVGLLLGLVGYTVTTTWGIVGLVRGAHESLQGNRPTFATFTRFDGAVWALIWRWLAVGLALILIKAMFGVVGFGLYKIDEPLVLIPLVIAMALAAYLLVNQQFFLQITLFEERNLIQTIQRGSRLNDPRWWQMLGFIITLALVNLLVSLVVLFTGFIVAIPLMFCISTAAYLQLSDQLN